MNVHDFQVKTIAGKEVSLSEYKGKTLLIVNVASQCGLTPQYAGLESLYEKYKGKDFEILGFPCNQFGSQEPGTETEIKTFCESTFGIKFPLFSKVDVNGPSAHPLYQYLTHEKRGFLGSTSIKWNFTKFLVDREGNPVKRYAPTDTPEKIDEELAKIL
ncbi:MAG: glutathione peroxidase [Bdellovibrionota bacterium]